VASLVPQNPHAPLVLAALDLEHLRLFEPLEPWMSQVERHGDGSGAVGGEPLVGEVEMQWKTDAPVVQFRPQERDALRQRAFDGQRQVRHPEVEQCLVAEFGPILPQRAPASHELVGL